MIADCTYPMNQGTTMCVMNFASYIQSGLLIAAENLIYRPLSEDEWIKQTCYETGSTTREKLKDPMPYTIFIVSWTAVLVSTWLFGFNPEMKRSNAERRDALENIPDNGNINSLSNESEGLVFDDTKIAVGMKTTGIEH